ncbi:MAG TPA: SGNH/GDSL hydrolase family protein [Bryobacteraceae bacterium]|nr:SGNH/GDSL hydrolase family protein [Bryobacteraceae bacterium]
MRLLGRDALVIPFLSLVAASLAFGQSRADLSKLVVVGDSLSGGVQNFSLLDTQQPHGYASIIADKAKVSLTLPLVPSPGAPNVLQLTSLNPLTIAPVGGSLPAIPRDNPCAQPTNLSVPGITVEQALSLTPTSTPTSAVEGWLNIVLGFPNPFSVAFPSLGCNVTPVPPQTMIQQAVALEPTTIIEYLGNNDALVPALTGALTTLTPLNTFASSYDSVLDQLAQTHATIITATIPDVTKVPYFTPVSAIAAQANLPTAIVAAKLGIGPNDLLRLSATPLAAAILSGHMHGPLPGACPSPIPGLVPAGQQLPCVLRYADALFLQLTIDAYNVIIFAESIAHGATVVDIHGLVNQIAQNGYKADGKLLTTAFLGGLFSLDGVHPSDTGYAIIANEFITVMNNALNTKIPQASVNSIAAHDPLVPPIKVPAP